MGGGGIADIQEMESEARQRRGLSDPGLLITPGHGGMAMEAGAGDLGNTKSGQTKAAVFAHLPGQLFSVDFCLDQLSLRSGVPEVFRERLLSRRAHSHGGAAGGEDDLPDSRS